MANRPTAYEELREKHAYYNAYETAIAKGGYPENLPNLATLIAQKEGLDEGIVKSLKTSTNFPALSKFLRPGLERFGREYESFGKDNLEAVIDSTPEEKLHDNLLYLSPKKKLTKYKDIAKLHKEAAEMQTNFGIYTSKEAPQELRAKAFEKIQKISFNHFIDKYKNSQSFLSALVNYIQTSPDGEQIILSKYTKIASDKITAFYDKVKDKIASYVKEILPKKDAPKFYKIVLGHAAEQQAQRMAA